MPEPSNIRVRIVGATDVGLVREHNEDNYLIIDLDTEETDFSHLREYDLGQRGALLVVCDGMGGAAAGEVASQMAVLSMRQQLLPVPPAGEPATPGEPAASGAAAVSGVVSASGTISATDAAVSSDKEESELHKVARRLRDAAQRANQEIYEAACADIAKAGMGTTLTALMLLQGHVAVAQVGDSRAYLWRQGKLTQITHDQSLVNQLLDSGQITPEQAKLFEHSNVILQALGVQEDIEVVLSSETLRRDDRLLLCSDGLVGVVSDEEIQEVLGATENLEEGVHRLIDMARAGGGPDNITVILAQAFGDGLPPPGEDDVAQYRAMALDGDRPMERRTWSADYSYAGGASTGRELGPSSSSSGRFVSPVSLLSMAAVLALAVTGLVVGLVLYPQRQSPAMVACSVSMDQPGLQVMVDDKFAASSQVTGVELKLSAGEHKLWLSNPQDGARRSEEKIVQASTGQRCEVVLRSLPATGPGPGPAEGLPADGSAGGLAAARDGGADAGAGAAGTAEPDDSVEPNGPDGDTISPGTPAGAAKLKRNRPRRRLKGTDLGTGPAPPPGPSSGTEPPAAPADLASPAAAPPVKPEIKPPVKPEGRPLEPSAPEKATPAGPASDKAAVDKPASEKATPDKAAVDKPASEKAAPDKPPGPDKASPPPASP